MAKVKNNGNKNKNHNNRNKNDNRISNVKNQIKEVKTGIIDGVFVFTEELTVSEFATKMKKPSSEIIKYYFMQGMMLTQNTLLNEDQIGTLCLEWGVDFKKEKEVNRENVIEEMVIEDDESLLEKRPPIITIMGHVDHGKTSLLDKIRQTKVTEGEAGGITQHIGAYQVTKNDNKITFIDTPGHAAFTEMRARGASVTDIVIIVVAADDGVKPQTKEAVDHAKAATDVTIIVAINKMDKPTANPEKVKGELSELGLVAEEWGGDTIFKEVSAMTGQGIDELLETINVIAEVNEYKANPNRFATGTVIEAHVNKGSGSVATLIINNGTLKQGDPIVVGKEFGRVRTMINDDGVEIKEAAPSTPVSITGLSGTPNAGDKFSAFGDEKSARKIAEARQEKYRTASRRKSSAASLDEFAQKVKEGNLKEILVIVKTDFKGTAEALKAQIEDISVDGTRVKVIRADSGGITESDILLAEASGAIIYGFNARPMANVKQMADQKGIEIRSHSIIYKILEELELALAGMLDPVYEEKVNGTIEVLQLFSFSKVGTIAGSTVRTGVIKRNNLCRVIRKNEVIIDSKLSSLRIGTEDQKEIKTGHECGITIDKFNDIQVGDIVECYENVLVK